MKLLYIYKTEPDKSTQVLAEALAEGKELTRFNLYENTDYAALVEQIFANDEVVSWW